MRITLGSTNTIKERSVRHGSDALNLQATITIVPACSGVSAQPSGEAETTSGARNRARAVQAALPGDLAIGIENGLRETATGWEDWAVVVVLLPDGREIVHHGQPIPFPTDAVEEARTRGFATTTAGEILAQRTGSNAADPHSFLTGGRTSRLALLTEDVTSALRITLNHLNKKDPS